MLHSIVKFWFIRFFLLGLPANSVEDLFISIEILLDSANSNQDFASLPFLGLPANSIEQLFITTENLVNFRIGACLIMHKNLTYFLYS